MILQTVKTKLQCSVIRYSMLFNVQILALLLFYYIFDEILYNIQALAT